MGFFKIAKAFARYPLNDGFIYSIPPLHRSNNGSVMRKGCFSLFTVLLLGLSMQSSYADDCLMSTNPPRIVEGYPGVQKETLDRDAGFYSASLENGDQIMVSFSQCELSLRGHYLVRESIDIESVLETFLSHMAPAQEHSKKLVDRLRKHGWLASGESILLDGVGDQHRLTVKHSDSRLFEHEIHYEWLPPLH